MSNKIKMCKLFLISVILTASLSLSFSTNNYTCEEKKDLYELQLSTNYYDPDVVKFAEDGWEKLVAEGRTRGATERGNFYIHCAKVQVADTERRYTILVVYTTNFPRHVLKCIIFVMTSQTNPLAMSCFKGRFRFQDYSDPAERDQHDMYFFLNNNKQFCP